MSDIKQTKIIAMFSTKGGAGKSTMAIAIAGCLNRHKLTVGLLDADAQGSTYMWGNKRNPKSKASLIHVGHADTFEDLERGIDLLMGSMDYIIIDVPGVDSDISRYAIHKADLVTTPIRYGTDIDVFLKFGLPALQRESKPYIIFMNAVKSGTNAEKELRAEIESHGLFCIETAISDYLSFPRSYRVGETPYNQNPYMKESQQIKKLTEDILGALHGT